MNIKAAGLWTSLALAIAQALITYLNNGSGNDWVTPATAAVIVIIINAIVKTLQLGGNKAQPPSDVMATPQVQKSKLYEFMNG